jgi:hypothetical protein
MTAITTPKLDPTPGLARQVLELYESALAEVQFPDLDLCALQTARDALQQAQLELERVESELAHAREQLEAHTQTLNAKAERALAYARIYAQGDAELSARIAEVGRKKPGQPVQHLDGSEPKKRGRKKKADGPSDLFTEHPETADALAASEAEDTTEDTTAPQDTTEPQSDAIALTPSAASETPPTSSSTRVPSRRRAHPRANENAPAPD